MNSSSASLTFKNVSFSFGNTRTINDFFLEVKSGSFTTLLGPSGCGKTTLLKIVSGFLTPDSGSILIDGADCTFVPPEKRQIGMVFQDYALFPHMTVQKNLLYGLEIKNKNSKEENFAKIHKTARILGIANLLERFPHELSGGQQQRVALGRALVLEPKILLMDEPLSSLDAKLRTQVREELKDVQSQIGITTLYVTHDQEEALSLSDTIAVLKAGKLQQVGTPRQIYFEPANDFVADAVGRANFIKLTDLNEFEIDNPSLKEAKKLIVRPEWFFKINAGKKETKNCLTVSGTIVSTAFLGQTTRYRIRLDNETSQILTADLPTEDEDLPSGQKITLKIEKYLLKK
ncbi:MULTISPECIES: ABC transporter ATP-binding protein [unclassified Treponema]|uniref:ABC transporter ATP-binding protein n=1 Tax=unclassified Treponema TaxID=2638727 RepID=UPI0025FD4606|nr:MULTISPECIES: ABC transporter ATP-binding protein [unclassified Treponema]